MPEQESEHESDWERWQKVFAEVETSESLATTLKVSDHFMNIVFCCQSIHLIISSVFGLVGRRLSIRILIRMVVFSVPIGEGC